MLGTPQNLRDWGRVNSLAGVMSVDGEAGIAVAPAGRLRMVMTFTVDGDFIDGIEIVADPQRLASFILAVADRPLSDPVSP